MLIKRNKEIWKTIKGFSNYEISNFGRVKSLNRKGIMKIQFAKNYPVIGLWKNSKRIQIDIHLLVIYHFGKPKPSPKHECNHIDGDKRNNWNINLEWMTPKENSQHAHDNGLCNPVRGINHPRSKLIDSQVKEIRKIYKTGKSSFIKLGKKYGVDASTIKFIIKGQTWSHI